MRQILRQFEVQPDPWRYPDEVGEGPRALTLAALQAAATAGTLAGGAGVLLGPGEDVLLLAPCIAQLALVIVQVPKPGDGRAFSQAQLLRQRLGFRGELRATGAVRRDQLFLLARCGCDAFELAPGEDVQGALAQLQRFSVAYQRAADTLVQPRMRGA